MIKTLLGALAASLLAHLAVLLWLAGKERPAPTDFVRPTGRAVELEVLDAPPAGIARSRAAARADAARREEREKLAQGRVVDVPPTPGAEAPPAPRFLAEKNARAEKETVSRHRSLDYQRARSSPEQSAVEEKGEGAGRTPEPKVAVLAPHSEEGGGGAPKGEPRVELPEQRKADLRLRLDPRLGEFLFDPKKREVEARGRGQDLALDVRDPEAPDERREPGFGAGSERGVARAVPRAPYGPGDGAPAPDHLPDVAEGEFTALNAAEFKYATFFNRFKQAVAERWHPDRVLAARDPTGRIYGVRDRYTLLAVVLDAGGDLADLTVEQSSGLSFLDEEALSAVRRAQPFPNPPRGLAGEDGRIRFSFGFFVEMGGGPRLRVLRRMD